MKLIMLLIIVGLLIVPMATGYFDGLTVGHGDKRYCRLTGCVMQGNIDMGGYNFTNANYVNMTILNASTIELSGDLDMNDYSILRLARTEFVGTTGETMVEWTNATPGKEVSVFSVDGGTDNYIGTFFDYASGRWIPATEAGWGIGFDTPNNNLEYTGFRVNFGSLGGLGTDPAVHAGNTLYDVHIGNWLHWDYDLPFIFWNGAGVIKNYTYVTAPMWFRAGGTVYMTNGTGWEFYGGNIGLSYKGTMNFIDDANNDVYYLNMTIPLTLTDAWLNASNITVHNCLRLNNTEICDFSVINGSTELSKYLELAGGNMTGNLNTSQNVTARCLKINNSQICDWTEINQSSDTTNSIRNDGDNVTGLYTFGGGKISNLSEVHINFTSGLGGRILWTISSNGKKSYIDNNNGDMRLMPHSGLVNVLSAAGGAGSIDNLKSLGWKQQRYGGPTKPTIGQDDGILTVIGDGLNVSNSTVINGNLTINGSSLNGGGNIIVTGCIVYNGGTLGSCT